MVYPRASGKRSLATFIAFCAVNLCVGGVHAASAMTAAATCSMTESPGDAAVGIRIVTDSLCAQGGLGCINDVCRFCKVSDTAQSNTYLPCAGAPAPAATTPCPTTKAPSPPPTTKAPTPPATTPCPSTKEPTPPPTTTALATAPPAYGSADKLPTAASAGECPIVIAPRDVAAGIQLIRDDSCVNGGNGCVYDVCRFCKVRGSLQSATLERCSYYGKYFDGDDGPRNEAATSEPSDLIGGTLDIGGSTCETTVSNGDKAVGIQIVTYDCASNGGVGCIDANCRFCRAFDNPASMHLETCAVVTSPPPPNTLAPAPAPAPAPAISTSTSSSGTLPAITMTCSTRATKGDFNVGIDIYTDVTCVAEGVGCFQEVCRFCKRFETPQAAHFKSCASIDTSYGKDIGFVVDPSERDASAPAPAPIPAPAATTVPPPTQAPSTTTPPMTQAPLTAAPITQAPATAAPAPATSAPATSAPPTSAPTPAVTSTPAACAKQVSYGDSQVGISAFAYDCTNGGVGCFSNVCRFCRTKVTVQSKDFVDCPAATAVSVVLAATKTTEDATSLSAQFTKLAESDEGKWFVGGAAAVGVAAAVAMLALGIKRLLRRAGANSLEDSDDPTENSSDTVGEETIAAVVAPMTPIAAGATTP